MLSMNYICNFADIFYCIEYRGNTMKSVYFFGRQRAEGQEDLKNLLGGKGANLAEMRKLGLPVPSGFTISTKVCDLF